MKIVLGRIPMDRSLLHLLVSLIAQMPAYVAFYCAFPGSLFSSRMNPK